MIKEKTYFLDMFSGIGGFALAAYNTGLRFDGHYFSEIDEYAVSIYKKRFPDAIPLGDIRGIDYEKLPKGEWFVTGGFPCQPHSLSGKREGQNDKRDLWPMCAKAISKIRPRIALFENVPGIFNSNGGKFFNKILSDISKSGYDAEWQVISAQEVGAPHKRERVWIVVYASDWNTYGIHEKKEQEICKRENTKSSRICTDVSNTESELREGCKHTRPRGNGFTDSDQALPNADYSTSTRQRKYSGEVYTKSETTGFNECGCSGWWAVEPDVGRVANGIPFRMDRLSCLGNAIVPQCGEKIMMLPAFDRWRAVE